MAHGTNIISQVKLPNGTTYEIHDAQAIHSVEELGLSSALVFKGVKKSEAEVLAITSAKVGDIWLVDSDENVADGVTAIQTEYVCVAEVKGTANANAWEKLGNIHDAASTTHMHMFTGNGNANLAVTAQSTTQFVTGVTATAATLALPTGVTQPIYEPKLREGDDDDDVPVITSVTTGTKATVVKELNTESITIPGYSNQTVVTGLGTASTANVTSGFSSSAATVKVVTTDGTAPSWAFSVSNGILTISGANGKAPVTANQTVITSATAGTTTVVTGYNSVATTQVMKHGTDTTKTVATGVKSTADAIPSITPVTQYLYIHQVQNASLQTTNKSYVSTISSSKSTVSVSGDATGAIEVGGTTGEPVS